MKIIRAPLRISLFGGGTDLDPFCSKYGSTIISFAIDRYMYLTWNPRPTGGCRLSYSTVEELDTLKDAEHTLVRETARTFGIDEPCTLTIVSDVPKGTGLGSSSALAVCLVKLARGSLASGLGAVARAAKIESACSRAGWQDYLPAVFGRFNTYHIPGGWVLPAEGFLTLLPSHLSDLISTHGLLLYTGATRKADDVLPSWQKSESQLHQIKALADEVAEHINGLSPRDLGIYLNLTWELKRSIPGVTTPVLNRQYALAMIKGALGGKLCGAGSGGCWFFLVPPDARERVKQALGLREIPFQIAEKGVETWEL